MRVLLALVASGILVLGFQNCGGDSFYTYDEQILSNSTSPQGGAYSGNGSHSEIPASSAGALPPAGSISSANNTPTVMPSTYSIRQQALVDFSGKTTNHNYRVFFDVQENIAGKDFYVCVQPGSNCAAKDYKKIAASDIYDNVIGIDFFKHVFEAGSWFAVPKTYTLYLAERNANGTFSDVAAGTIQGYKCGRGSGEIISGTSVSNVRIQTRAKLASSADNCKVEILMTQN